jgi:hypothetical protein
LFVNRDVRESTTTDAQRYRSAPNTAR